MAALAKAHQIVFMMCATLRKRNDVVYFPNWSNLTMLLAQLTNRMFFDVKLSDSPPAVAVALVSAWVTLILVVMLLC